MLSSAQINWHEHYFGKTGNFQPALRKPKVILSTTENDKLSRSFFYKY